MNRIGSGKCLILPYASLAWSEIHENELTETGIKPSTASETASEIQAPREKLISSAGIMNKQSSAGIIEYRVG